MKVKKIKKISVFLLLFILIVSLGQQKIMANEVPIKIIKVPKVKKDDLVEFNDSKLEKLIKEKFDQKENVTVGDLSKITYLDLDGVTSLDGLEHLHHVEELAIRNSPITDFSALDNYWKLERIFIHNTNLRSMSQLENLGRSVRQGVYQHELYLSGDSIEDLNGISEWESLERLYINANKLKDLGPLLKLEKLKYVEVAGNNLSKDSKEILRELKRKDVLINSDIVLDSEDDIFFNSKQLEVEIRKLLNKKQGPLTKKDLSKIENLDISDKEVTSLGGIQYAENLKTLNMSNTKVNWLTPLEDLKKLEVLNAAFTPVFMVDLEQFSNLKKLDLSGIKNIYISNYKKNSQLEEFTLVGTQFDSFYLFDRLPQLKKVDLTENYYSQSEIKKINEFQEKGIEIRYSELPVLKEGDVKFYLTVDNSSSFSLDTIDSVYLESLKVKKINEKQDQYYNNLEIKRDQKNRPYIFIPNIKLSDDYSINISSGIYSTSQEIEILSEEVEVTLYTPRKIKGKIIDNQQNPIVKQKVVLDSGQYWKDSTFTNEYGEFEFDGSRLTKGVVKIEGILYDLPLQKVDFPSRDIKKDIDIGTFQIDGEEQTKHYIKGRVIDEDSKPVHNIYLTVESLSYNFKEKIHVSSKDGYFEIRNILDGDYKITVDNLSNYQVFEKLYRPSNQEIDIVLKEKRDAFNNESNNYLRVSKQAISKGQYSNYQLDFENNETETVKDLTITWDSFYKVNLVEGTVRLNNKKVELNSYTPLLVGDLQPGEKGKLTFSVRNDYLDIGETEHTMLYLYSENMKVKKYNLDLYNTGVSINGPTVVRDTNFRVFGKTFPGAKVEIYVNNKKVDETSTGDYYWEKDIDVGKHLNGNKINAYAKVLKDGVFYSSEVITIDYAPEIPKISNAYSVIGENRIELKPYFSIGRAGVIVTPGLKMPAQNMNFEFVFDRKVENVNLTFLNKNYPLLEESGVYKTEIEGDWIAYDSQKVELSYEVGSEKYSVPLLDLTILIDPSGYTFEGSMENRLSQVQATIYSEENGEWNIWNSSPFGQINPQLTDSRGRYGWDVPKGDWKVTFTKEDYLPYTSRVVSVPPPETELNVPLISTAPLEVKAFIQEDDSIKFEFNRPVDNQTIHRAIKIKNNKDEEVKGSFILQDLPGYLENEPGFFIPNKNQLLSKQVVWKSDTREESKYHISVSPELRDYRGERLDTKYTEIFDLNKDSKLYSKNHEFKIHLNEDFDINEAVKNIQIKNNKGDLIPIKLSKVKHSVHIKPTKGSYEVGEYKLRIGKDFKNLNGKTLSKEILINFQIENN